MSPEEPAAARLAALTARMRDHGYAAVAAAVGDPPPAPWRLLADLLDDPEALRRAATAHGLSRGYTTGTLDLGVAVGLLSKSLLGGPVSTLVSGWALERWAPDLRFANLAAHVDDGGAVRTAPLVAGELPGGTTLDAVVGAVEELAERSIAAVRGALRIGTRHLWGNVALQTRTPFQVLFPAIGPRADRDYEDMAERFGRVRSLVSDVPTEDRDGRPFHVTLRRTCCLLYKVPGKDYCSTCNLVPAEAAVDRLVERALARRHGS